LIPQLRFRKELQHGIAITRTLRLDGPPQHQRLARIGGVLVALEEFVNDGEAILRGQAARAGGELKVDFEIGFTRTQCNELLRQPRRNLTAIAKYSDAPGTNVGRRP